MKSAMYIPNDLWEKAQAKAQAQEPAIGDNKSKVVQLALELFVTEPGEDRPAFARERPAWVAAEVSRVRKRLLRQARRRYEAGYRAGIQLVEQLPWDHVSWLAGLGWEFDAWVRTLVQVDWMSEEQKDSSSGQATRKFVLTDEGRDFLIPSAVQPVISESSVYQRGFIEAVRDVWESISSTDGRFPADTADLGPEEVDPDTTDPDDLPFD